MQPSASIIGLRRHVGVCSRASDDHGPREAGHDRSRERESNALQKRGRVILWDDTFVRYHEPHIGIAAVKVLEALGFEVALLKNRRCCGRPAFSQGNLDAAATLARHNISQLLVRRSLGEGGSATNHELSDAPIVFLEPSCWSMFVEDYRELKIENAEPIAARCFLFEQFVDDLLMRDPQALPFRNLTALSRQVSEAPGQQEDRGINVVIHPHCHAKSILDPAFMARLAERLPGRKATVLDTACCGMAGAFGALAEKYDLSIQVAQRLLDQIEAQPNAFGVNRRHRSHRLRHKLPPSNYRSHEQASQAYGGIARRGDRMIASNSVGEQNSKSEYRNPKQATNIRIQMLKASESETD